MESYKWSTHIMSDPQDNKMANYYIYGMTLQEKCIATHKLKPYTFNINDDFETSDNSIYKQQVNYQHECLEEYTFQHLQFEEMTM